LRPAQERILTYTDGPMGISAVPGSGKTFTLSLLAARLVARMATEDRMGDREVLVVTFTNSAVANFRARIGQNLRDEGLLPGAGYRVRTLHALAHDIVRERPALVGLSEQFDIVDENTATEIKREAVQSYLRSHPDALAPYIKPEFVQQPRRIERFVVDDAIEIANMVIRLAKELPAQPHALEQSLKRQSGAWPLLDFGLRIYADYQRSLVLRGAVDFDDLISKALEALNADEGFRERLQTRWPYILEDEAQDSSRAQEEMLRLLTARTGNWVRVGDPNQAINTTFTSANTKFLQQFLLKYPEQARTLPNSGRSAQPIIDAANALIQWSRSDESGLSPERALAKPEIEPAPPGDPQPNPAPGTPPVYVHTAALTPDKEIELVVRSLQRWLPQNADQTVAVLVPENQRGTLTTTALQNAGLPFDDNLLRTGSTTRAAAEALATLLYFIAEPQKPGGLQQLWGEVWYPRWSQRHSALPFMGDGALTGDAGGTPAITTPRKVPLPEPVKTFANALGKLREPEAFVFPEHVDWLDGLTWMADVDGFRDAANAFRTDLQRWSRAAVLPVDELLLTLGNDLFSEPADLALTHRLAVLLAKLGDENPAWRLPELAGELQNIAQNKRRILGFGEDAQGPVAKPGVVTVTTMHAAKGLEWDRVYLLGVNNYSFPDGSGEDSYRSERWYVRDRLNLVAETAAQLKQLNMGTLDDYVPGRATVEARADLAAERLRLLYVGITRARRELIVTYNVGREGNQEPLRPALAFVALQQYLSTKPA